MARAADQRGSSATSARSVSEETQRRPGLLERYGEQIRELERRGFIEELISDAVRVDRPSH